MKRTGMEPWFDFWAKVRYAIDQVWIEFQIWREYRRAG